MNFNKNDRKKFQIKILQDQLKSCWTQFHSKAQEWLEQVKMVADKKVPAGTGTHPNQIMADLKKINYQRTYLEYKIYATQKNRKLPVPAELLRKMQKAELSVNFQQEFPSEYQQFTKELKKKLMSKPYRPIEKVKPTKEVDIPWKIQLQNENHSPKMKKSAKKPSPSVTTIIRAIHGHGKSFRKDIISTDTSRQLLSK